MEETILSTKVLIQKAFISLYSEMDYNSITIKELCMRIPIARTTFYAYYSNMDECKADIEAALLNGLKDWAFQFLGKDLSLIDLHKFLKCSMLYIEHHWEEMYAFLVIQPNVRFIEKWKEYIREHFKGHYREKQNHDNYKLISEMIASSAMNCYRYWMQNKEEVNEEKLFQMIQAMINSIIPVL